MPVRPSHRLDVHLVPDDRSERALAAVDALIETWRARGFIDGDLPGPRADALVQGGFARVRRDDPGAVVLYANAIGGFEVRCPDCGAGLARELRPLDRTTCPACGGAFELEALRTRPPAARGRAAVVLVDAQSAEVSDVPEGWRRIWRRVG